MSRFPSLHRPTITLDARAKINLALAVGPPRPTDGYHPIASWMARLDLADELTLTRLDDGDLSRYAIIWHPDAKRTTPIDWSITKDLAVRAHLMLQEHLGRELPVQARIRKRIPVGGGLAGGSADAAAMLLALDQLFELGLSREALTPLAMRLGSDVAYCLHDAPAFVDDFGARVTPTPPVRAHAVLVFPEFPCPTGAVYRAFDAALPPVYREADARTLAQRAAIDPAALFNDLAAPACAIAPDLAQVLDQTSAIAGAPAHVSGSGSTVFVVCANGADHAADTATRIERESDDLVALPVVIGP
jgi:4-diphosphocytidyl-2-C-methyl-D-erythritol kinase